MAKSFLSTANTFLPSLLPSFTSSASSPPPSTITIYAHKHNVRKPNSVTLCKEAKDSHPILTKRTLAICLTTSFTLSLAGRGFSDANAAILEADDDEELLERVKRDRKKRLERQGVINSSNKEKAYLQELVYKLSKVGQAIDNSDLSSASSVLGPGNNADWVQKANIAFTKLSLSLEEKTEVDTFNSSLASLISSVTKNDIKSSKIAFVSSAIALEKWTALTGLAGQLKGL